MGVFSFLILLPKLIKTCKKGEFFCPRCCWVKYWEIKLVKMQYFTLKKSVFVSKQQSLPSLHGVLTKNSKNSPKFGQKEGNSIFLENLLS